MLWIWSNCPYDPYHNVQLILHPKWMYLENHWDTLIMHIWKTTKSVTTHLWPLSFMILVHNNINDENEQKILINSDYKFTKYQTDELVLQGYSWLNTAIKWYCFINMVHVIIHHGLIRWSWLGWSHGLGINNIMAIIKWRQISGCLRGVLNQH